MFCFMELLFGQMCRIIIVIVIITNIVVIISSSSGSVSKGI
jgi:hypothetical protein